MAVQATAVAEVRTTGSDTNGGFYDPGISGAGTDYTQQAAAQLTLTDLATSGIGVTTLTSVTGGFAAAMIGNAVNISSGTNVTAGIYFVTAVASGNSLTLDRAPDNGAGGISAGHGSLGGALASIGKAGALHVGGNTIWLMGSAGTQSVTSASSNVAGGCLTLAAGASASAATFLLGYDLVRGDNPVGDRRPLIQAGSITTLTLLTTANKTITASLRFDGAARTSARCVNCSAQCLVYNCKALNATNGAFVGNSNAWVLLCEATGCASATAMNGGQFYYCSAHDNTFSGVMTASGQACVWCSSTNNSGATSDGFDLTSGTGGQACLNCTATGNGRDGFRVTAGSGATTPLINCTAHGNAGSDFNATATEQGAAFFNVSGTLNAVLTGKTFTNPSLVQGAVGGLRTRRRL